MKSPLWFRVRRSLYFIVAVAAASVALVGDLSAAPTKSAPRREWNVGDGVVFDSQFSGARLSACERIGANEFRVVSRPENTPINDSAWFAFKVSASEPRVVTVQLKIDGGSLRYRPKISFDGISWITLPAEAFKATGKGEATLLLEIGPAPLWVAAQEIVDVARFENWSRTVEALPFATRREIGRSIAGRPLHQLLIGDRPDAKRFVSIVGRQHPPETTGSLALMKFVETLAGDSSLAREFRREFTVAIVPVINPDGVEEGHWRHNLGGVDTNRDWGVFAQPETRAVRDSIVALAERGRLFVHLDFHSTKEDVFYTQPDDRPASPAGFTGPWIKAIGARFPDYEVKRSSTRTPTLVTSHNWAHLTFKIPAITYEIGDNTDRALLQQIAAGAAEEMMRRLLALKDAP